MTVPEDPSPPDIRIQQDEFPPVLFWDQMDSQGRSSLFDLYEILSRRVAQHGEDELSLQDYAQWLVLRNAYRHGSVNVRLFRTQVNAAWSQKATVEEIGNACNVACRLFRNPAGTLDAETLLAGFEKGKAEGPRGNELPPQ